MVRLSTNLFLLATQLSSYEAHEVDIVVARYSEDLTWLIQHPFNMYRHVVYTKKLPYECSDTSNCATYQLPNVGRESHTYLTHIIRNYDSGLADVTMFLPGSAMDQMYFKKRNTLFCMERLDKRTSIFPNIITGGDILATFDGITLDSYVSTHTVNKAVNPESTLRPCEDRPFGKWYRKNFPEVPRVGAIAFGGIFAVAKEQILQHPKEYYENLLTYLSSSSNPECGHFFERGWGAIFYPYPDEAVYYQGYPSSAVSNATYAALIISMILMHF